LILFIHNDTPDAEWRRLLLEQIRQRYEQCIAYWGKTPGDQIQIPAITLPPIRGKFTHLSNDKLFKSMNYGLSFIPINRLSAEHMETLLRALHQIPVPGE
jgi:hypothetical protein